MTRLERWLQTLNVLMAKNVMKQGIDCRTKPERIAVWLWNDARYFSPSTVTDDALEAALKLYESRGYYFWLRNLPMESKQFQARFDCDDRKDDLYKYRQDWHTGTASEALCLAMLSALGVEVPPRPSDSRNELRTAGIVAARGLKGKSAGTIRKMSDTVQNWKPGPRPEGKKK